MNKNALRLLIASALLSPATLFALGLGEIRLNSALNQPFDADIEVVSASTDELNSLKVALASEDQFKRYGLDRPNFLSGFSLRVEAANAGRPVIKVRSTNTVTEPFLNLLVEVSWTGGRVLREYTVLLDPPVFAPSADQPPVLAPRGGSEATRTPVGTIQREAQPTPSAAPTPAPAATPSAPAAARSSTGAAAGGSYTVKPADSLSKIASTLNNGQATERQTMVALYRANPEAFAGNMNVLRAGSVLRIPPTADIQAIPSGEAAAEVSRQIGAWRASAAAPSSGPASERLRLVPPEQGGAAGGQANAKAAAAANERIQSLEAQLAEAKRLLDLRNAELAQMQKRVGKPAAATSSAASSVASSVSVSAAPEPTPPVAEPPAATVEPAPTEAAPPPPPPVKPQAAPPAAESPGLFETLSQYGLWLIIAGLALIGGLIAYFRRRQAEEDDNSGETLTAPDFQAHLSRRGMGNRLTRDPETDVDTDEHESLKIGSARAMAAQEPVAQPLSEDTLSSETAIHVDQQDALAEADFHMAYGLYDQAADIVKLAIERQPERRELKLKLAEIFFVWGNTDSFLEVARQLHSDTRGAEPGEWDKILIMGKQICPDDPLFSGDIAGSRSADQVDLNLEGGEHHVDIDLYDAPTGDQPKTVVDFDLAATGERAGGADSGLDFLLDEPQRGVDEEPTREMDGNARTQETPTIESPYMRDRGSATIREKFDEHAFNQTEVNIDSTAELSLDEIGLDVADLEGTGGLSDSLETTGTVDDTQQIGDNDMTRVASRRFDANSETKTMVAPHMDYAPESDEESSGNTITVEQIDLENTAEQLRPTVDGTGMFKATQKIDMDLDRFDLSNDTVEQPRGETSETGVFRATQKIDMDLDYLSGAAAEAETLKTQGRGDAAADAFSEEVFGGADPEQTVTTNRPDKLADTTNITELNANELISGEFQIPEMEPVTMSEVGTKLDLARAYMDMGDPDGARSILQEVLDEGNSNQKQEAQRLLESIG